MVKKTQGHSTGSWAGETPGPWALPPPLSCLLPLRLVSISFPGRIALKPQRPQGRNPTASDTGGYRGGHRPPAATGDAGKSCPPRSLHPRSGTLNRGWKLMLEGRDDRHPPPNGLTEPGAAGGLHTPIWDQAESGSHTPGGSFSSPFLCFPPSNLSKDNTSSQSKEMLPCGSSKAGKKARAENWCEVIKINIKY